MSEENNGFTESKETELSEKKRPLSNTEKLSDGSASDNSPAEITRDKSSEEPTLFLYVPTSDEVERISVIETDGADEELIEKEAISSLPEAPSLDLLLYDTEVSEKSDEVIGREDYDNFLNEYKETMMRTLALAKEQSGSTTVELPEDEEEAPILVKIKTANPKNSPTDEKEISETAAENSDVIKETENTALTEETAVLPKESITEEISSEEESAGGEQLELDIGAYEAVEADDDEEESEEAEVLEEEKTPIPDTQKPKRLHTLFEMVELFVFTLTAVLLLTNFVFRHSEVSGGSMLNTLHGTEAGEEHGGDHLIISDLFYTPDYGDIVVFASPENGTAYVKRVVALEGDVVDVYGARNGYKLYVNGELIEESYVYIGGSGVFENDIINYVVKKGEVYVLGDHRNNSHDSRMFGSISTDRIYGKVLFRFYPFESFGPVD